MREVKKHWWRWASEGKNWRMRGDAQIQVPLCNSVGYPKFANKKSAVTCKNCKRLLLGFQPSKQDTQTNQGEKHG